MIFQFNLKHHNQKISGKSRHGEEKLKVCIQNYLLEIFITFRVVCSKLMYINDISHTWDSENVS